MKKIISISILSVFFLLNQYSFIKAEGNFDPKLKFKSGRNLLNEIKKRDFNSALKMHKINSGSFFGLSVDFQLGYGTTYANANATSSTESINTTSKGGFMMGALLNVNLFNIINFSTGLDFTKKNFGIEIPYIIQPPTVTGDSVVKNLSNSYLNIPLNINFGGMVSENVGISFSGGPYFGFLLNPENAVSGYKDFDFGVNGILTGKYYLNPFFAILLGTKGQYGGLNNLISTSSVEDAHTFNWGLFSGVSVGI